jgi:hypothetical protein
MPPLKRFHSDAIYEVRRYRDSLEYWRRQPTYRIVESLRHRRSDPRYGEYLKVTSDGTVMQGNTRVKVLQERGYNVNNLRRYPA